jgi:hypothetical protein
MGENGDEETVFYYPGPSALQPDGRLFITASGYTLSSHWSGYRIVTADDPDYDMWLWILKDPTRFEGVSTDDLARVRGEFLQESTPS